MRSSKEKKVEALRTKALKQKGLKDMKDSKTIRKRKVEERKLSNAKRKALAEHAKKYAEKANAKAIAMMKSVKKDPLSKKAIRKLFSLHEANMEPKLIHHIRGLYADKKEYLDRLKMVIDFKVADLFSSSTKGRILAAVITVDRAEGKALLANKQLYGFGEVAKALALLDAPRKRRQLRRKLKNLEAREEAKLPVKQSTIKRTKMKINELERDMWKGTSLNGAMARIFKRWFGTIDKSALEFFLLNFPTETWKPAFDALHMNPEDLQLKYFQKAVYDKSAIPKQSLVHEAKDITMHRLPKVLKKYPELSNLYSYLRRALKDDSAERVVFDARVKKLTMMGFSKQESVRTAGHFWDRIPESKVHVDTLVDFLFKNKGKRINVSPKAYEGAINDKTKALLAKSMPLDEALWWYHELACSKSESALQSRLEAVDAKTIESGKQSTAYGKLMERLLYFRECKASFSPLLIPFAEYKLKKSKLSSRGLRTVVAGDASGSMEVAIKSATILGSLLSIALDANLIFFNDKMIQSPCQPKSAVDVLKVVENTKAAGATSMAAALWPFFENKIKLDLFILVSDEGENVKCNGYTFAQLWVQYLKEVNPRAKVMLISFLAQGDKGLILERLEEEGVKTKQHRLDPNRPDTSKFDGILGLVALKCVELKEKKDNANRKQIEEAKSKVAVSAEVKVEIPKSKVDKKNQPVLILAPGGPDMDIDDWEKV